MTKGIWIAVYEKIENMETLKKYAVKATAAISKYSGKFIVRGGKYKCLEGNEFSRTVIWEFPNYDTAEKCYNSKEYQEAWKLAQSSTVRDLQIVEGV